MLQNKIISNKKGFISGIVVAGSAIALLLVMVFFSILFGFYSDTEKKLSDRVAFGLSAINYFYISEKNINEFLKIVTETTAKELGEECGGFDCYSWKDDYPTINDIEKKFKDRLKEKITGFPDRIGKGGKMKFIPPSEISVTMDYTNVRSLMKYHKISAEKGNFKVEAGMPDTQKLVTDKNIRYFLLAKIGQRLYGNGTYVRDWNKVYINSGAFDCDNDGIVDKNVTGAKLSSANVDGCKIISIDFDVTDSNWNDMKDYCKGKHATVYDPGANAGRVEGNKIYVQIDYLLEYSLICGIEGTDGIASIVNTYGQVSKSSSSGWPTCTEVEAGHNAWEKANMQGKIQTILNSLANVIKTSESQIDIKPTAMIGNRVPYTPTNAQNGWTVSCGSMYYDTCGCPSKARYCKTGDICGLPASFNCRRCGECLNDNDNVVGSYCPENVVSGYCCPKEYPVFDSYTKTCYSSSDENLKIEKVDRIPPPGSKTRCDSCRGWIYPPYGQSNTGNPDCSWSNKNDGTFCSWTSSYNCGYSGDQNSGSTSTSADYWWGGVSACGNEHKIMNRQQSWKNGIFSETRYDYRRYWKDDDDDTTRTYSCTLGAYFKFTFTPDISFKIIDKSLKIVKKGTTDFEDLYFLVKFKPSTPYVIGE